MLIIALQKNTYSLYPFPKRHLCLTFHILNTLLYIQFLNMLLHKMYLIMHY